MTCILMQALYLVVIGSQAVHRLARLYNHTLNSTDLHQCLIYFKESPNFLLKVSFSVCYMVISPLITYVIIINTNNIINYIYIDRWIYNVMSSSSNVIEKNKAKGLEKSRGCFFGQSSLGWFL